MLWTEKSYPSLFPTAKVYINNIPKQIGGKPQSQPKQSVPPERVATLRYIPTYREWSHLGGHDEALL